MYLKTVFVLAPVLLAGSVLGAAGDFVCPATEAKPKFTIQLTWAQEAMANGGTTTGLSGFPHDFHGASGSGNASNTQLVFYGADARCNQKNPDLLEFPVMKNGSKYNKDEKRTDGTKTPARVVYLKDGKTLCGVMSHVTENPDGTGAGNFRVCDKA